MKIMFYFLTLITIVTTQLTYSLDKNLKLMFWFDSKPPTQSDKKFFDGVAKSINVLKSNNIELEQDSKRKSISIVSYQYAENTLSSLLDKHHISKAFFYDLEKAQLIMVTRMFLNNCRVNKECSEEQAINYSEQFLRFAEKETSKERDTAQNELVNNRNNILLSAMVGAFVVSTVSNVISTKNEPAHYNSGAPLSNTMFGNPGQ